MSEQNTPQPNEPADAKTPPSPKTPKQGRQARVGLSFAVEADHPRNSDLMLQGIMGARLRSRISSARRVIDRKSGEPMVPIDQARHLGQFPEIPGQILRLFPETCEYEIVDPLCDNEQLLERLRNRMREAMPFKIGDRLRGVPAQKGKLDKHRFKTLVREVWHMINNGHARVVEGVAPPQLSDVDSLDGDYLLNPGSRVHNSQPTYEKDLPDWQERIAKVGG